MTDRGAADNWTVLDVLDWTRSYFSSRDIDSPRLTAEMLLCHCLGFERIDLYLQYDRPLNKTELSAYKALISRRANREPVAYITGRKGFWESEFSVAPGVLIPRPDTETLVEKALELLGSRSESAGPATVLELGVGSGAISVSIASTFPEALCIASDISWKAIETSVLNAGSHKECARLFFVSGSWFGPFRQKPVFDLIVSNPPYIPSGEIPGLQPEIVRYEPWVALDGGKDGLDCIREIVLQARHYLQPGGDLLLEIGAGQRPLLESFAATLDTYEPVEFFQDYSGHERVAKFKKKIANKARF